MKALRRLCVAPVFALALTISAFAGDIQTTVTSPPPPRGIAAGGEIQNGVTGQEETGSSEATAADSVTESVLNLIQSVLSLF